MKSMVNLNEKSDEKTFCFESYLLDNGFKFGSTLRGLENTYNKRGIYIETFKEDEFLILAGGEEDNCSSYLKNKKNADILISMTVREDEGI